MRIISSLISLAALGYGGYWVSQNHPEVKHKILEFVNSGSFHTLEARYSAKQIMDSHKKQLLKDDKHKFLTPVVKFTPYLLMEVKYTLPENRTGEGILLWDQLDGEMVLNTQNWEKTHGFGDCITANIEKNEFKIINLLAQKGGTLDREGLGRIMQVEPEILGSWLDSCRKKRLIVQSGNHYRLHLQSPKLHVKPETNIDDRIVTKSYKTAERVSKRYSKSQIKRLAEAAFGADFAIRNVLDVYLPIYSITVENPDGSMHTSYWNAINGKQISFTSLLD